MKYAVTDIIKEVRKALEFNNESSSLIQVDDIDTLSLNEIVESKILDAIKFIESHCPVTLCDTGLPLNEPIAWEDEDHPGTGMGSILLPDDYMRLLTFEMSDWSSRAEFITEEDPSYQLQKSQYAGLRGNPEAPVVAIVHYPEGLMLEFYCCDTDDATIRRASYLPLPSISNGMVDIPQKLYSSVIYYAGYLVSLAYSAVSVGNALLEQAYVNAGMTMPKAQDTQQSSQS